MPLPWPGLTNTGGELPELDREKMREYLDVLGDRVAASLEEQGLTRFASPWFRPFDLAVAKNPDGSYGVILSPLSGGIPMFRWITVQGPPITIEQFVAEIRRQLGWEITLAFLLPDLDKRRLPTLAKEHVEAVASAARLSRLGDLKAVPHLRPHLEVFLGDHPDPERTVFVMMPFKGSGYLDQAFEGVRSAADLYGLEVLRADDRAYSDQLWPNVETYLVGCRYGVAIFEDLDAREFKPNVSLELGYMLGLRKRCLLLKEKRLPKLPADIVGHLYKPWDAFDAETTVAREVDRWLTADLGLRPI